MDTLEIEGCFLVNKVIQPIHEEDIGMTAPTYHRTLARIVIRVVIDRNIYGPIQSDVTLVFLIERIKIIFGMTRHKHETVVPAADNAEPQHNKL